MKRVAAIAGVALGLMASGANASLFDRGNGMVYDDVLKITWGPQFDGDWDAANIWVNNLVYGGYDDWRLPALRNQNVNERCSPQGICSEMAYMYYTNYGKVLGWNGIYGSEAPPPNTENWALIQLKETYWSDLLIPTDPNVGNPGVAYYFDFRIGYQAGEVVYSSDTCCAIAVRDGDVAASVPEPGTVVLLSLSLGVMGWVARRKRV